MVCNLERNSAAARDVPLPRLVPLPIFRLRAEFASRAYRHQTETDRQTDACRDEVRRTEGSERGRKEDIDGELCGKVSANNLGRSSAEDAVRRNTIERNRPSHCLDCIVSAGTGSFLTTTTTPIRASGSLDKSRPKR